jgi:hypothetical protein
MAGPWLNAPNPDEVRTKLADYLSRKFPAWRVERDRCRLGRPNAVALNGSPDGTLILGEETAIVVVAPLTGERRRQFGDPNTGDRESFDASAAAAQAWAPWGEQLGGRWAARTHYPLMTLTTEEVSPGRWCIRQARRPVGVIGCFDPQDYQDVVDEVVRWLDEQYGASAAAPAWPRFNPVLDARVRKRILYLRDIVKIDRSELTVPLVARSEKKDEIPDILATAGALRKDASRRNPQFETMWYLYKLWDELPPEQSG